MDNKNEGIKTRVNLGKTVSKCLHIPNVDGFPVYSRVDTELERSPKWFKCAKDSNNSPSNIRRVFITYDGVFISFYRSVGNLGRNTFTKYDNNLVEEIVKGSSFSSHVLNSFDSEWVLSNIEELYVDFSVLLNTDYLNEQSLKTLENRTNEEVVEALSRINVSRQVLSDIMQKYLDLQRYDRLLKVVYIPNLKEILKASVDKMAEFNSINNKWFNSLGDIPRVEFTIHTDMFNTKFTCKSGTYSYDLDVLTTAFTEYTNKIIARYKELNPTLTTGESNQSTDDKEIISKLVVGLDSIKNINALTIYLNSLLLGLKSTEKISVLTEIIDNIPNSSLKDNLVIVRKNLETKVN